jgi:iron complex outermembrane receptor protein
MVSAYLLTMGVAWSQKQDSLDYYDLTLQELMNIKIVSASKKSESLFDAALSASVLTREEIKNAGATSIMEALRLMPGLIVRQQTNGNYDVHVRGLDNVPPNSLTLSATNTTTLVMINNRPVYNYLQGGTFWESLPIDLNDVDKIEVVRGPSSTLYGPNAVSGVINIITRKLEKDGLSVNGSGQFGSQKTSIVNTSVGYKFSEKFDIGVSGNYQSRGRDVRYLDYATYQWVNSPNDISVSNPNERYPHPDKSMIKSGVNAFLRYNANQKASFNLSSGIQDAEVQCLTFDNSVANVSTATTNSRYVDFQASTYGLNTQVSYATAVQAPVVGMMGSKYDYNVTDASTEYEINVSRLSIKPGVTYRSAVYNDGAYWDISKGEGTLGGKQIMNTIGGGVRFEYKLLEEKLRLTGGIRMDKFSHPDKWFTSYQAAASYKLNDKNLIRLVYSKAYRSPFIFDTYLNYQGQKAIAPGLYTSYVVSGNENLALLNSNMMELGYRSMLRNNISLDVEGYYTQTQNYTALIQGATQLTPANYPVVAASSLSIENIPMTVKQMGTSISLTVIVDKFQIKPFVTFQKTTLKDYSPYFTTSTAVPAVGNKYDPANNNVNSGVGSEQPHKFTPKAYGGAYINYSISTKFNFNLSTYWYSQQTFYQQLNTTYNDGVHGVQHIDGKAIVNAKLAYMPVKGMSVFVNAKNILNKQSVEYYQGDATPRMVLGGVSFDF